MQLIWVSGPTARVVTLSITTKKVMSAVALASLCLVLLGGLFHFVGLRVAVEYSPALVHSMGGVTSQSEQDRIEAGYRAQLAELHQRLNNMMDKVQSIEDKKNDLARMIGWDSGRQLIKDSRASRREGQGGPLKLWPFASTSPAHLNGQLESAVQVFESVDRSLDTLDTQWRKELARMERLPTSLPLQTQFNVTSSFGVRPDPMSGVPSMHEGIDLVAEHGTSILATAPGVVVRSEHAGAYGQLIEVRHAEGFSTRYAHMSQRKVNEGQQIERGQVLGLLGNTGRSTGPHLHYEILHHGQPVHPARAFTVFNAR